MVELACSPRVSVITVMFAGRLYVNRIPKNVSKHGVIAYFVRSLGYYLFICRSASDTRHLTAQSSSFFSRCSLPLSFYAGSSLNSPQCRGMRFIVRANTVSNNVVYVCLV